MRVFFLKLQAYVKCELGGIWGGVLGLAFKGGIDDIRKSPPLFLVGRLYRRAAKIMAYDPRPWSAPRK